MTGCSTFTDQELSLRRKGVVDACYTLLEYNPKDKDMRIDTYLQKKTEEGILDKGSKEILENCIKRTESSKNWKSNVQ
jgi:hypothetical protein